MTTREGMATNPAGTLYLAFELGWSKWVLGFSVGLGQAARRIDMTARDLVRLREEIAKAKRRFGLPATAPVVSCYEAGRDGAWLHRWLVAQGIANRIVDAASIEVNRRYRRAKNDRLDVEKLLTMLLRYEVGEQRVWKVVHVPSPEAEDLRQPERELLTLKRERTQHVNRIKGLLAGLGLEVVVDKTLPQQLPRLCQWDGQPVPPCLQERVLREFGRTELLDRQLADLENGLRRRARQDEAPQVEKVRRLLGVRGIGPQSAWMLVRELFGWRKIRNRRELAALAGLVPTPYDSGQTRREQGISKAGSKRVRWLMVELAWDWLYWQPESELSRWYQARFGHGSPRQRKLGIVALARKLLVALWRLADHGTIPAGAVRSDWYQKVTGRKAKRRVTELAPACDAEPSRV